MRHIILDVFEHRSAECCVICSNYFTVMRDARDDVQVDVKQ